MRLSQIQNNVIRRLLANVCLSKATLAINGAGAATIKTTGTTTYTVDGVLLSKAALAAQALVADVTGVQRNLTGLDAFYVQPINSTVYYIVVLDSAGNVKTIQGTYAGYVGPGPNPILGDGNLPENIGDSFTPIGIIKVVTNGATTFTPATTLLDAAGLTVTYVDVCMCPGANP
jgi:hypothetical protein